MAKLPKTELPMAREKVQLLVVDLAYVVTSKSGEATTSYARDRERARWRRVDVKGTVFCNEKRSSEDVLG